MLKECKRMKDIAQRHVTQKSNYTVNNTGVNEQKERKNQNQTVDSIGNLVLSSHVRSVKLTRQTWGQLLPLVMPVSVFYSGSVWQYSKMPKSMRFRKSCRHFFLQLVADRFTYCFKRVLMTMTTILITILVTMVTILITILITILVTMVTILITIVYDNYSMNGIQHTLTFHLTVTTHWRRCCLAGCGYVVSNSFDANLY